MNEERAAAATTAATAVGGRVKTSRDRSGSRHSSPGQTDLFQRLRTSSGVTGAQSSDATQINTSWTTPLPHAEAAGQFALANSLQVDETMLEASLGLHHLLLHLPTGPVPDKVVTIRS